MRSLAISGYLRQCPEERFFDVDITLLPSNDSFEKTLPLALNEALKAKTVLYSRAMITALGNHSTTG
jgi:hypothetical protein